VDSKDRSVVRFEEADPLRTYTEAEEERLARNLHAVTLAVHRGDFQDRYPDRLLLCDLHAALFHGVRGHGGRVREEGVGSETLTFGPNRSTHRDDVLRELETVFAEVRTRIQHLDAGWDAAAYEQVAIQTAVWAHAMIIRIHPFEDGNGRTSRLFLNVILVRLGLRPVAIDVAREEYRRCLNHFYQTGDIRVLLDLVIRAWSSPDLR
jgi:Fic family protein